MAIIQISPLSRFTQCTEEVFLIKKKNLNVLKFKYEKNASWKDEIENGKTPA